MLVAKGLRKRYRSREVVRDFGLTLDAGEVVGLLGPNGAGKTTCFYMIVGLVPADEGEIVLDGRDITSEPMYTRARLGRSEEHTSELQSLMRISYAVFCLK